METAILQMLLAKGVGEAAVRRFCKTVSHGGCQAPSEGLADSRALTGEFGFAETLAQRIVERRREARDLLVRLRREGVSLVWLGHPSYPAHVLNLLGEKAPPVLFLKGNRSLLDAPGVGFCGSRKASARGLSIAERCARLVADRGYSVVSGYAAGVDERAHCAAMRSNGRTIMVLAEGILRNPGRMSVRDLENERNHLYVSQFPPDCAWFAHNAMRRNELILGLSGTMIVIEAGEKGGSLAAGESSLSYKEPLFVVDYKDSPQTAVGNRLLLQKGASPIRSDEKGAPVLKSLFRQMESKRYGNPEQMQLFA